MKKSLVIVCVLVISLVNILTGCSEGTITGSGNLETRNYDFTDFTQVEVGNSFKIEMVQSDSYYVSITADDNLFSHISVSQEDTTLVITLKPDKEYLDTTQEIEITMPELQGLKLTGVPYGTASGFSSDQDLEIEMSAGSYLQLVDMTANNAKCSVSDASEISGDLTAQNVECYLSGASKVLLEGTADNLAVDASEASRIRLGALEVEYAYIVLSGGSNGAVNPTVRLDAELTEDSSLGYVSDPEMGTINISDDSILMPAGHAH